MILSASNQFASLSLFTNLPATPVIIQNYPNSNKTLPNWSLVFNTYHCESAEYYIQYCCILSPCIFPRLHWSRTKFGLHWRIWKIEECPCTLSSFNNCISGLTLKHRLRTPPEKDIMLYLLFSLTFPTPVSVKIFTCREKHTHKGMVTRQIQEGEKNGKPTLHPQALKLFCSLSSVPVCSQFGSQPTAQTVFLIQESWRKWKCPAYLSDGGPKNLSNTGRTLASGNKCGWYSFLICSKEYKTPILWYWYLASPERQCLCPCQGRHGSSHQGGSPQARL